MIFHSLDYLIFLPCVVVLFFFLPPRWRWVVLLASSYAFYGAWRIEFLPLLMASTLTDYVVALSIYHNTCTMRRKLLLSISVLVNIGLLVTFKYLAFGWNAIGEPLQEWGLIEHYDPLYIILPLGISFYTFQTLGYTIDVYRNKLAPEYHLGYFATYVTYFPQLLAGPIERAGRLLPQLRADVQFDRALAVSGIGLILLGFFKKLVIADRLGTFTDSAVAFPESYSPLMNFLTAPAVMYRYYCDMSGYADIAIGSSLLLGIRLTTNFNRPFAATSVTDFWHRWHITVTHWFRDYVLVPLAGRRSGWFRRYAAVMLTTVLIGLWHGANSGWLFGGFFAGILAIIEGFLRRNNRRRKRRSTVQGRGIAVRLLWALGGMAFVWVLFFFIIGNAVAFGSADAAIHVLERIISEPWFLGSVTVNPYDLKILAVAIMGLEVWQWLVSREPTWLPTLAKSLELRWATYAMLALSVVTIGVLDKPDFLYFDF